MDRSGENGRLRKRGMSVDLKVASNAWIATVAGRAGCSCGHACRTPGGAGCGPLDLAGLYVGADCGWGSPPPPPGRCDRAAKSLHAGPCPAAAAAAAAPARCEEAPQRWRSRQTTVRASAARALAGRAGGISAQWAGQAAGASLHLHVLLMNPQAPVACLHQRCVPLLPAAKFHEASALPRHKTRRDAQQPCAPH